MAKLRIIFTRKQGVNEATYPGKAAEEWLLSYYPDLTLSIYVREYIQNERNENINKIIILNITGSLERCQQYIDDINSSETMVNKVITDNAAYCDYRIKFIE